MFEKKLGFVGNGLTWFLGEKTVRSEVLFLNGRKVREGEQLQLYVLCPFSHK